MAWAFDCRSIGVGANEWWRGGWYTAAEACRGGRWGRRKGRSRPRYYTVSPGNRSPVTMVTAIYSPATRTHHVGAGQVHLSTDLPSATHPLSHHRTASPLQLSRHHSTWSSLPISLSRFLHLFPSSAYRDTLPSHLYNIRSCVLFFNNFTPLLTFCLTLFFLIFPFFSFFLFFYHRRITRIIPPEGLLEKCFLALSSFCTRYFFGFFFLLSKISEYS